MPDGLITSALVMAVLLGVGSAAFFVMRSPGFWVDAVKQLLAALLPAIVTLVTKRMTPEEEARWRDAQRRGQGDQWLKRRNRNLKG